MVPMHLLECPVGLDPIVRPARRDGVDPAIAAAEGAGEQVVDGVAAASAWRAVDRELAGVGVAQPHAPRRVGGWSELAWVEQANSGDDGGYLDRDRRRMHDRR